MQRAMAASSRSRDGTILINRSIDYGLVDGIIDGGVREGPSEKTVCVCVCSQCRVIAGFISDDHCFWHREEVEIISRGKQRLYTN